MIWITSTEKDADKAALEKRLWAADEEFRGNEDFALIRSKGDQRTSAEPRRR